MVTEKTFSSIEEVFNFIVKRFRPVTGGPTGQYIYIVPREKNDADIAKLGITKLQAKKIIAGIRIKDYCCGPDDDHDEKLGRTEDVWVFRRVYEGKEIYIKLKVTSGNNPFAKCLSFHLAEHPMEAKFSEKEISDFSQKVIKEKRRLK